MNDELIGQRLGQYLITEVIARGGMATVYKATQPSLDRVVAIKVLRHDADPQFIARFKREARATAALQHHNILPIHDYNDQNGLLYFVLQYVEDGRTLGSMLGKPMATVTALQLMSHICDALDYAHKRGIIHRDIKPTNILMPSLTWPMLADFGIAKLMNGTQLQLTLSNQVIGTAIYLAPEQVMGRSVDARTDLYSAGVVLYELVTGRVPFDGDTPMEVWNKHVYETPPSPRRLNPDLPAPLETLLLRALAKNPNERYQSVTEMAAELSRIAIDLDHDKNRSQITGLYEVGVQAFEQGQWEQAVDRLGKLVALDPGYEDASELLDAAREAHERTRTEARQQIEMVRQRRQSGIQQPIRPATASSMASPAADATTLSPATPAPSMPAPATRSPVTDATMISPATPAPRTRAPATVKLPALDQPPPTTPPLATRPLDVAARSTVEAPAGASTQPLVDVAAPTSAAPVVAPATSGRRLPIAWIVAAAMALVLLLALFFILRGGGQPNTSGTATTAAQNTPAGAFTAVPAAVALTAVPTTAAPTTAPTAAGTSTAATAPTALAALPAPAGQLAYADDFGTGAEKSGLVGQQLAPDLALAVDPAGVFSMNLSQPNQTRWVFLPRLAVGDFSVLIDLSDGSPDRSGGAAQGLVFRGRDSAHFYALLIDPRKAAYSVRKQDGTDHWTDMIATTPSALIRQDGVNQLRLDAAGDKFTIYINGVKLDSARDSSYTFGMLGTLIANADARASTMRFDNLQIWSNDPPAPAATLPATRQGLSGDMVLIHGGEFVIGSNDDPYNLPQIITLTDFYIDAKEVTNGAYMDCADRYGCSPPKDYATASQVLDRPVVNVTWEEANYFCAQAGKRLPSEAEWEKAAGWNTADHIKTIWPWGDRFDAGRLNSAAGGRGDTLAVATFPSNPNGTFDMAGNVAEWTHSLFKPYPYDPADGREDPNPKAAGDRVVRGGSWAQPQDETSTYARQAAAPDTVRNTIGFRCAAAQ